MSRNWLLAFLILAHFKGFSQNIDSLLSIPRTLKLSISTPQPRLGENFKITLDETYLRAQIFKSAIGKIKFAETLGNANETEMVLNVNALVKGKNVVGPLEFILNGTKYTTNKIEYEVVDALPNVDKGIWIRKVNISDSLFCIIIEQRIPANPKTTVNSEKSTTFTTEPEYTSILKFKDSYSINGLSGINSSTGTDYGYLIDDKGEQKQFFSAYSVYYFKIENRTIKIVITGDKFDNIPNGYGFQSILIHPQIKGCFFISYYNVTVFDHSLCSRVTATDRRYRIKLYSRKELYLRPCGALEDQVKQC